MTGQRCHAHIATTIAPRREPVRCTTWLPSFALICHDCGTPSPFARIARFVADPPPRGVTGDLVKAIERSAHRRPS